MNRYENWRPEFKTGKYLVVPIGEVVVVSGLTIEGSVTAQWKLR